MTNDPRAFFAIDSGAATTAASLVGHLGGRWRLLASGAVPATVPIDPYLSLLAARVAAADPDALARVARSARPDPAAVVDWPRLVARSSPPAVLAVLAGTRRRLTELERAGARSGWRVRGGSADELEPLALAELALDAEVGAVLLGAGDPPGGDERPALVMLASLVAAISGRRPELRVVLSGGAADLVPALRGQWGAGRGSAAPADHGSPGGPSLDSRTWSALAGAGSVSSGHDATAGSDAAPGHRASAGPDILLAPAADAGLPAGVSLVRLLEQLRVGSDDSRTAIARATASLAMVLDRRVESVDIGHDGGLHCRAEATGEGHASVDLTWTASADAALVPPDPGEDVLDGVDRWTTLPLDRNRLADLLRELRMDPWGNGDGDGAVLRLAAARAALCRLVELVPDFDALAAPDLVVAAGGAWALSPPPSIALALADALRRPGTSQLAWDQARLLGPLGTIEDEGERRRLLLDLVDDVLAPLATVIVPRGLRMGRSAGRLRVRGAGPIADLDLLPGTIELVDMPPGQVGTAELDFREAVDLGVRGRQFETAVSGGLGGLLLDLRDVPLRLPERGERRRSALATWQEAFWPERDA